MFVLSMLLLGIFISILLCSGASSSKDPNLKKVEQGKMSVVHYNDHSYIVWSINAGGGFVHDPDCRCRKE